MAVPVESAFIIFGGILFIGYFGELLAKRFAIPSALLLLAIGYLLRGSGYVEIESLSGIQELFGSLALIILLFDGGLSLNIYDVVYRSGRVMAVSAITTILSIIGSSLLFIILGLDPIIGAIIGAIAGGIGSSTTISIVKGLSLPKKIKDFLTLESSITDVFSIILTIVFTQALISGALDIQAIGQGIVGKFSIGLFIGITIGVVSLMTLVRIEKGYNYMLTFAIVLILYALTELLNGSGAIAVLVFGLVFGNETTVRKLFRINHTERKPFLKQFQTEISFFIRTLFFVFLGAVVTLGSLMNFLIAFGLVLLFYLIRYSSVRLSVFNSPFSQFSNVLTTISPRGLATAVLATYPLNVLQNALVKSPDPHLFAIAGQIESLPEISFYIIVLSIVFTTILVPIAMHKNNCRDKGKEEDKHGTD